MLMSSKNHLVYLGWLIIVFFIGLLTSKAPKNCAFELSQPIKIENNTNANPVYIREKLPMPKGIKKAHSATLTKVDDSHLLAMYFAGSREGGPDVKIYSSIYDIHRNKWSTPKIVLTREKLRKNSHQLIRKLGNPVIYNQNGKLHLFVVATAFAGWAASKIYHFESLDKGKSFNYKATLYLSPFFNLSTLIRASPLPLVDGGFFLPAYHELESKYPLMLRFDKKGSYTESIQINHIGGQLQPSIIPLSSLNCLAGFRNANKTDHWMRIQYCQEGGLSWLDPQKTNIKNMNNSINLFNFNSEVFLVHNRTHKNNIKGQLVLSRMENSTGIFSYLFTLDTGEINNKSVTYPSTLVDRGYVDIIYDKNANEVIHIRFNKYYLDSLKK
ncbi:TPA: exo-alpha-sialidase [Legionella pneumophila]|nr:sialidase family protein [Legionella pneumophila]AGH52162.1 BNR/Asp-box repeat protein [Legionella pneumophila subsp. pneumophila LPE509]MCK1862427.1 exo-alpha-sialidase [Legionella pneumophila]MCW8390832.1 exo-alpha-sialidase [Legionella pneumophila]MCW8493125.1 exo-alpha-sialidase [Legionella pneumophila]MCZ4724632.1 exo-alpha-sialidase [Legionella pneumophila]